MERWAIAGFGSATAAAIAGPVVATRVHPALGVAVSLALLAIMPWSARALPAALDGSWRRHRLRSLAWAVLATLGVLQMGGLSAFMADDQRQWGATVPDPLSIHHQCLSAYVYAADLQRHGVTNLYAAEHYPIFDPPGPTCRLVETEVEGLAPWVADAYQYPPTFLLLPRAALALTGSFASIRAWWFVLQALALLVCAVRLAVWLGGREGLVLGLMIPAVLASLETLFNLQFGQLHAAAMMLACASMIMFHGRRAALGGALLAAAVLSKLFPAILLVVLLARRDWRALAWTSVFVVVFALLGLVVLGSAPYTAFFSYQVPRMVSGAAFHFTHEGAHAVFLASRNFSIVALTEKLRLLGATGGVLTAAAMLPWLYTAALVVIAALTARGAQTRTGLLLTWLALLNLAALRSPMAPSAYVLAPVLWMLALLATRVQGRSAGFALAALWIVVVGPPPLPERVDLVVNLVCQLVVIGLNAMLLLKFTPPEIRLEPGSAHLLASRR